MSAQMSGPPASDAIWAALPIPAFVIVPRDGDEIIVECNPAAELFMSMSAAHLKRSLAFEHLRIDAPMAKAVQRARTNRAAIFINDAEVRTGNRAPVLCNLQLAPMHDTEDGLLLLVAPRDVAGRLGRARAINAASKSAIGMAEMLAHEIKNPLAGISGAAQLLAMGLNSDDLELTDLIVAETRRIVTLLDQVEQFGDQRPPDRRATNIHDVLERARRLASVGFAAHMRFEDDYDPSLPNALADPDQLLQVILNLLKNASQVQPSGGKIAIRTYFERGLQVQGLDDRRVLLPLHIEIIDDGPGVPLEIADNVFEPFVSGRENGTGLGLALVSKIVAAHEGWIDVASRPGHTVFRVSLPIAPVKPAKARDNAATPKERR